MILDFFTASISGATHEKDTRTEFENMLLTWGHGVRLYTVHQIEKINIVEKKEIEMFNTKIDPSRCPSGIFFKSCL